MHRTTKIKITELNPHVICVLCGGYYINATTINECLHSFCRTCITRYLETSKYCPICDVMVHKTRPLDYIRSDKTLQDLVYKLVPGLYKSEMKRRRDYYAQHPGAETLPPSEDRGVEFHDRIIYTEDEKISLSLELCAEGIPFKTPSAIHGHNGPDNIKISDVRYLVCPAAFSVGNLKKFIRMKFDLKPKYEIDIFQTAEPLADFYTLMDIAYIYTWTRRAPLRLYYTVYERLIAPKAPTVVSETQVRALEKEKSSTTNEETENDSHGLKRKHDDGPDDVSFDLSTVTPDKDKVEENKKETGNPRKKKKQVDNTVLEAVSKSEEILAKLTLNSSNDADGLKADAEKKSERTVTEQNILEDQSKNAIIGEKSFPRTPDKPKEDVVNKDESPVSLLMFEPLTVGSSGANVYDFHSQEPSSSGEVSKPKAKRGRKKKVVIEPDKKVIENSLSEHIKPGDTNLVISNKHPVMRAATPKNEGIKKLTISATEANKSETKTKKLTNSVAKASGKGKTVKEILERAHGAHENRQMDKIPKKRGRKPGSLNKVKKTQCSIDGKDQLSLTDGETQSKGSAKNNGTQLVESASPVTIGSVNRINDSVNTVLNTNTTSSESSFNETVSPNYNIIEDPVTPPYGQTPKPDELNPALPVSVNGDVALATNCAVNTGMHNDGFINGINGIGVINGHDFRPVMNGYIPTIDTDQPLDLTNNSQRSEYTKGKIFKTKLLKKTVSKPDGQTESGDRNSLNGNNLLQPVIDGQL